MPVKRKPSAGPTKRLPRNRSRALYSSLSLGLTPVERRAKLEKRMRRRGLRPIADFDAYLQEVSDFWPQDETCDQFLAWLRGLRREGQS
jgi:hypothetical protein